MESESKTVEQGGARRWGCVCLGGVGLLALAASVLWWQRTTLASGALDRALASRGVPARYTITAIGAQWQRVENLVIGDPARPDLTAQWADVRLSAGWGGVRVTEIRAGGARLRGRYSDGALQLGALDKLLPKGEPGKPFAFPDLQVSLNDARLAIATPNGTIGARIDGRGNPAHRFDGKLAAIMPRLTQSGCSGERLTAYGNLALRNGVIAFKGPVRADGLACGTLRVASIAAALDATLSKGFDAVQGTVSLDTGGAQASGLTLAGLRGSASFAGPLAKLAGDATLSAKAARYGTLRMAGLDMTARYDLANGGTGEGVVKLAQVLPGPETQLIIARAVRSTAATPLEPLLAQLSAATARAGTGLAVNAQGRFAKGVLTIARFNASSASGLRFALTGGEGITFGTKGVSAAGAVALSGGGFPQAFGEISRRPDGRTAGVIRVEPYHAGRALVASSPIRFATRPDGAMLFQGTVRLNGPLTSGWVTGLTLPVDALFARDGSFALNGGCTPLSVTSLAISGLTFGPNRLTLCPETGASLLALRNGRLAGGARIAAPRINGRIGSTPLSLSASDARLMLSSGAMELRNVDARLGPASNQTRVSIATIRGNMSGQGLGGRFNGLSGQIARVPLLVSNATGTWRFANAALTLQNALTLTDAAETARFEPLTSRDFALRFADGRIVASGLFRHPETGTPITRVTVRHDLAGVRGNAVLDVAPLTFSPSLRPDQLTRLTKDIVQNVEGAISGRGDIVWTERGITSSGKFRTEGGVDFAAAFGPVEGLRGTLVFDDLLALSTPPDQTVFIDSINTGVPVLGGSITYQLLPGNRVAIKRGRWPLAGGTLTLLPTILDMGQPVERRLTFHVEGLDAAKFIQQLELENLAATGTFDGDLPMIFDLSGGRIEGGALKVRQEGGTIAYVGDVSNASMNSFGRMAFDALKSMRYRNLTINLDGPLDGEIVSLVRFTGENQSPLAPTKGLPGGNFFTRQFVGLPFRFNITIKAPFRSLISSARGFTDPMPIIKRSLPLPDALPGQEPVQPSDSTPKR